MKNIKVIHSGYAQANKKVMNDDFKKVIDTNDEWITTRTGIKSRYISTEENTSDLGYRAAVQAINNAKIDKNEIDLIIVASMTPDHITPSTACLIQEKLGLNNNHVMAFDVNAACSGFLYALQIACFMLQEYHCALVIGSETISKIIDYKDRNTCVLFGDGAGAMLLKNEKYDKQIMHYAQSIGDNQGILKANGLPLRKDIENVNIEPTYLKMDGKEVFRFAIKAMEEALYKVLEKANVELDEIDLIIPHQANIRIVRNVAKRLKIDESKFFINLDEYGNTSAASVAIAFAQAQSLGIISRGMKIVLIGFGAGFTYASTYLEL